jgi:hypothetical protein
VAGAFYLPLAIIQTQLHDDGLVAETPLVRALCLVAMVPVIALFSILSSLRDRWTLRKTLPNTGRCDRCGYDRSSQPFGPCPECGDTPIWR